MKNNLNNLNCPVCQTPMRIALTEKIVVIFSQAEALVCDRCQLAFKQKS